jgi:hypothetical protein
VVTNIDELKSDYDGLQLSFTKRMSNRWQMLGGVTFQRHEGFAHSGTFTNTGANSDFNNPNYRLNRDSGSVFTDLPWVFTLSGSYQLPYDVVVSGKYTGRAGDPLNRTISLSGFTQGTETVLVQPRGEDRTETVNRFIDVRLAKRFNVGARRFEGTVDFFNILNANHVLLQTEAIGTALGRPSRILAPRIVRFGLTARF